MEQEHDSELLVTTASSIDGHRIIAHRGLVRAIVFTIPGTVPGALGALIHGDDAEFGNECESVYAEAITRMQERARALAANAVVGTRYDTTEVSKGVIQVLAYGTAVKVEKSG